MTITSESLCVYSCEAYVDTFADVVARPLINTCNSCTNFSFGRESCQEIYFGSNFSSRFPLAHFGIINLNMVYISIISDRTSLPRAFFVNTCRYSFITESLFNI